MLDVSFSNLILILSSPGDFLVLISLSAPIVSFFFLQTLLVKAPMQNGGQKSKRGKSEVKTVVVFLSRVRRC